MPIQTAFKIWAITFGTAIALLVPPFQSPDEPNHFFRAWQISEGSWLPERTADRRLGGTLPASLASMRDSFIFLKNNYAARTDFQKISSQLDQPVRPADCQFLDFPNTAIYAPTAYLPQATAIFFARKLDASPLACLYFSRLANLLVWAFFVAASLRRVPAGRLIFAVLALLPASLVIAASANADVFSNALCFWLVAAWLGGGSKNSFFEHLALLVVTVNKLIFSPFALLFLEKNFQKNFSKKKKVAAVVATATVFAAAFFWAKIANQLFIPFDDYHPAYRAVQTLNEGVRPAEQLNFILDHPLDFLKISARSVAESAPSTAAHLVGKFGWEKNYLPAWVIAALWLAVLAVVFFEKIDLENLQRWRLVAVATACFSMFLVSNYCLWHPVGAASMGNFQGRYFVPIVLLVALAGGGFFAGKFAEKFKTRIFWAAAAVLLLGNFLMLSAIFERYF